MCILGFSFFHSITPQPFLSNFTNKECDKFTVGVTVIPDDNPFFYAWRINEVKIFFFDIFREVQKVMYDFLLIDFKTKLVGNNLRLI